VERVGDGPMPEPARQHSYLPEFRPLRQKALDLILSYRTQERVHAACIAQNDVDGWDLWQAALSVVDDRTPGIDLAAWNS
jgi:hypothetical protein